MSKCSIASTEFPDDARSTFPCVQRCRAVLATTLSIKTSISAVDQPIKSSVATTSIDEDPKSQCSIIDYSHGLSASTLSRAVSATTLPTKSSIFATDRPIKSSVATTSVDEDSKSPCSEIEDSHNLLASTLPDDQESRAPTKSSMFAADRPIKSSVATTPIDEDAESPCSEIEDSQILVSTLPDDRDIEYVETTQIDEEERQHRFGHVRSIRPHFPKPKLFFKSGPPTFTVQRKTNAKARCRSVRRPAIAVSLNRPMDEAGVYIFRDDVEFAAASRSCPTKRKRGPIYADAMKLLMEAFGITFLGPPSTLVISERNDQRKKKSSSKSGGCRQRKSPKVGNAKRRRKQTDDGSSPSITPRGTPGMRGYLFHF